MGHVTAILVKESFYFCVNIAFKPRWRLECLSFVSVNRICSDKVKLKSEI